MTKFTRDLYRTLYKHLLFLNSSIPQFVNSRAERV